MSPWSSGYGISASTFGAATQGFDSHQRSIPMLPVFDLSLRMVTEYAYLHSDWW